MVLVALLIEGGQIQMPTNANFAHLMYTNNMMSKLEKERMLYESLESNSSDKDFVISFHDYFSFIINDGLDLCAHLNEPIKERAGELARLDNIYAEIIVSLNIVIEGVEIFLGKKNLLNDPIFEDRLRDAKRLISNTTGLIGGERLDSIYFEVSDIMKRLLELGFDKELSKYVRKGKNLKLNPEDIIAFEKRKQFIIDKNNFNNKESRSLAGIFFKLVMLYKDISEAEKSNGEKIKIETIFEDMAKGIMSTEYRQLISGEISKSAYFSRDEYLPEIKRFHQSIVMNNQDADKKENEFKAIFYLKGTDIYHYTIGKLSYKLNGLEDPKYIKMFKNIITYMPIEKEKIRISELEKNVNKKDKCGISYRSNIGKNSTSFNDFLKKNGVKNIHPSKGVPIISATDEYITFHNKL
jgi:hypothetical protein